MAKLLAVTLLVALCIGLCHAYCAPHECVSEAFAKTKINKNYEVVSNWLKKSGVIGADKRIEAMRRYVQLPDEPLSSGVKEAFEQLLELSELKCGVAAGKKLVQNIILSGLNPKEDPKTPVARLVDILVQRRDTKCLREYHLEYSAKTKDMKATHKSLVAIASRFGCLSNESLNYNRWSIRTGKDDVKRLAHFYNQRKKEYPALAPTKDEQTGKLTYNKAAFVKVLEPAVADCKSYVPRVNEILDVVDADIADREASFGPYKKLYEGLIIRDVCSYLVSQDVNEMAEKMIESNIYWINWRKERNITI